ncbi:YchJ family protein [Microbacterium aurantiacum]|nr:YchJ family metal-binding protein [Microbacterium aurantiacum]
MDEEEPATAEALMRSRFAAFRAGDVSWLLRTWHPSTRPASLDLDGNPRWRGLQIVDTVGGRADDHEGIVEFRATYLEAGRVGVLHERSRFVREAGRWYYLDGDVRSGTADDASG